MRLITKALRICAAAAACFVILPSHAITGIRINDPGGSLTQDLVIEIYDTDYTIDATVETDDSVTIDTSFDNWRFSFDNPGDGPLLEGVYEGALRYPFQPAVRPGLDASGGGRGCNTLTGRFVVLEIAYDAGGAIDRFAADLSLNCDGISTVFQANIRINSNLPLILEDPTASAGSDQLAFERRSVELDATQSVGGNSDITSYQWTQTAGPAVTITSATSANAIFETPTVTGPPVMLTFEVAVTNDNGAVDTDDVTVEVRDRSEPQSWFSFSSTPTDVIGRGDFDFLNEGDGVFTGTSEDAGNIAGVEFVGDETWELIFTGELQQPLMGATDYIVDYRVFNPQIRIFRENLRCFEADAVFHVYEHSFGPGANELVSFSVVFEQICNRSDDQLNGELHYQAVFPEANAGPTRNEPERATITLDASESVDMAGTIELYEWLQTDGPPVTLASATEETATFTYELDDQVLVQSFEFQLTVTDESGLTNTDFVTINVTQNNQAPVAVDDAVNLQQGFVLNFEPLDNDIDADGSIDASRVAIVDAPAEGSLINNGATFIYFPPMSFSGITTATYRIYDNDGIESNIATITLNVAAGPLGISDSATSLLGAPVTLDLLANDQVADAALDPATIAITQAPARGSVTVNGDGTVTYTPFEGRYGPDVFGYDVADVNGLRVPMTFAYITVTAPPNPAPPPPVTPVTPPPPAPPTPAPAPAVTQTQSCSGVGSLSGETRCGGGAVSPLSFFVLALGLARVRRRQKSAVIARSSLNRV